MKKKLLLKLLKHQQFLTLRALDIILKSYEQETATDEIGSGQTHPNIHNPIHHVEPVEPTRSYQ